MCDMFVIFSMEMFSRNMRIRLKFNVSLVMIFNLFMVLFFFVVFFG